MSLKFDNRGHLIPYKRINVNIDEFEAFFVKQFDLTSTRSEIFKNYLKFLEDFNAEITTQFTQWINGSFVTQKENPKDIDFVTLIEHDIYKQKRELIDKRFRLRKAKEIYQVDAYTVEIYPKNHKRHNISMIDLVYWDNWFTKTKKNWAKKNFPKGYIEINFGTINN